MRRYRAVDRATGAKTGPLPLGRRCRDVPLGRGRRDRTGQDPIGTWSRRSQLEGAPPQSQRRLPLGGRRKGVEIVKLRPFYAVLERELVRMIRQRTRLVAAMVRPLIWLVVIGGGFNSVVGRILEQSGLENLQAERFVWTSPAVASTIAPPHTTPCVKIPAHVSKAPYGHARERVE